MTIRIGSISALTIGIILLYGCAGSPLNRYPLFLEKKNDFKSVSLMEEFLIIDAMTSDTALVNIPLNQKWGRMCLNYFASRLQEKGFVLKNSFISSVGLLADKRRRYKAITIPAQEDLPNNEIPSAIPPFYLNDAFKADTLHEQLLQRVYSRLVGYEKSKGDSSGYLRISTFLGKLLGTDYIAVLFVGGYNVHTSQQHGKLAQAEDRAYEKVSYENITQATMRFYIIDTKTGEIIWDDHVNIRGGIIYDEKLIKMARIILENIP